MDYSEATRLNNEARKLFNEGKFHEAGKLYEAANKADTLNSPIYLSNLALVELKLQQFQRAEISASLALFRDPRFTKARYRRAISRWKQGRHMDALVDLGSVLTTDPMDKDALAKFATILGEHESLGSDRGHLREMAVLMADSPSPYGSAAAPRPSQNASPGAAFMIPNVSERVPRELKAGTCASCKTVKWMREIKTCRGCSTAVYCNEVCQRNHWPQHKSDCIRYPDHDVLAMHLCKTLLDHKYIRMHLIFYAMRSIGALHHSPPPYFAVLLVFVKTAPVTTGPKAARKRQRLSIANIVTAPLSVLDKDTRDSYVSQLEQMRETCKMPGAPGVAIIVTPLLGKGREMDRARCLIFMHRVVPELVMMATQPGIQRLASFESHSFGVGRTLTSDLDELYWNLEDELANDAENYYGLQG
ncbi:hypothetical protein B0H16DRAFT_1503946 [Mycena metata]|uniref:MYND-type domain-containing protein n=1 Tax=Mycena metata TaxID=1033252 RepID=A0AAD7K4Z6_9AGAR|nr:hypothetical protein B0H16DRAFT_1503946 [Mycena metata]